MLSILCSSQVLDLLMFPCYFRTFVKTEAGSAEIDSKILGVIALSHRYSGVNQYRYVCEDWRPCEKVIYFLFVVCAEVFDQR